MIDEVIKPTILITNNPDIPILYTSPGRTFKTFGEFLNEASDILDEANDPDSSTFLVIDSDNSTILNFEYTLQGTKVSNSEGNLSVEFLVTNYDFEYKLINSFLNRFKTKSYYKDFPRNVFYVLFGVGDNLDYWSGFIAMTLMSAATLQDFDQPRTIQLNLAINLGIHETLDLLRDKFLTTETETINNINIISERNTALTEASWTLANEIKFSPGDANASLCLSYLFGFSKFDYEYKTVINDFLRSTFTQTKNLFFVCDDLAKIAGSKITNDKDKLRASISLLRDRPDLQFDDVFATQAYTEALELLTKPLDDKLGTEFTRSDFQKTDSLVMEVRSDENADNKTAEAKRQAIKSKVEDLMSGLGKLVGEETVLVREGDVRYIDYFIRNILGANTDSDLTDLPKPLDDYFDRSAPVILIGTESVVRALLYGERLENHATSTFSQLPENNRAFEYLNTSWRSLNLYESKIKDTEKYTMESLLESESLTSNIENFPVFRYNVANPNVLSIKTEENNLYTAFLYGVFTEAPKFYSQAALVQNELRAKKLASFKKIRSGIVDALSFGYTKPSRQIFPDSGVGNQPRAGASNNQTAYTNLRVKVAGLVQEEIRKNREYASAKLTKLGNYIITNDVFLEDTKELDFTNVDLDQVTFDSITNTDEELTQRLLSQIVGDLIRDDGLFEDENIFSTEDYFTSKIVIGSVSDYADAAVLYNRIFDFTSKLRFNVEIDTLPFFNISSNYWLNYPCLLYANRPKLIGDNTSQVFDSYLSAGYTIIGIKHKITPTSCDSNFTLQRLRLPNDIPKEA